MGLSVEIPKWINKQDFSDFLVSMHEGDFHFNDRRRIFLFEEDAGGEFYNGAFITIKDHKKFCELEGDKILISTVAANRDLMDFNFFVLHKKSGKLMYQFYHHSCSLNQFGFFLNEKLLVFKDNRINDEIKALPIQKRNNDTEVKKVKKKYNGNLKWAIMVKPENLKQILEDMKRISSFNYFISTTEITNKTFAPLSKTANTVRQNVCFQRKASIKDVSAGILASVNAGEIGRGSIKGYDQGDIPRTIDIIETPDHYSEYDFDQLVTNMSDFNFAQLSDNWLIKELQKNVKSNSHLYK